ncbi:MAG: hypothetical protein AB8H47_28430 [Bacteroidia bacterium]
MKKQISRFILLLILAVGMSWCIVVMTSAEAIASTEYTSQQHIISYQLPLGLPALRFSFYW